MSTKTYAEYSGIEKGAILMIALGPEKSSSVFKYLKDEEIEELTLEIANTRSVSPDIKDAVLDEFYKGVQQAAYEIINRKSATYYGVGLALAKIVKVILNNEEEIMTVSAYLNGEYGHKGMFIGVPAIIGNMGIEEIVNVPLNEEEQKRFDYSYSVLESMKSEIDSIIKE